MYVGMYVDVCILSPSVLAVRHGEAGGLDGRSDPWREIRVAMASSGGCRSAVDWSWLAAHNVCMYVCVICTYHTQLVSGDDQQSHR